MVGEDWGEEEEEEGEPIAYPGLHALPSEYPQIGFSKEPIAIVEPAS